MKAKLGSGTKFAFGVKNIVKKEGLSKKSAGAIMAVAGRKKYGAPKMAKMVARGRGR